MWSVSAKVPVGRLPIPNGAEEKALFYCGHPRCYRVRFERCGRNLWAKDIEFVAKFMHILFQEEVEGKIIVPVIKEELKRRQIQSKLDCQLAISGKQIADVALGRKIPPDRASRSVAGPGIRTCAGAVTTAEASGRTAAAITIA